MKISYQRGIQKNFMIIDPEEADWDGYECRMLLHNSIEGLLKMKIRPVAEGCRFYYDITSRQPLLRMLKGAQWDAEEFRSFMIQICDTLGRMEDYLLKETRILLDPELIYMEPESHSLSLCYVPGMERDFSEDLGNLMERLLECVDHRDRECVVLAYGLCQETKKENYGIDDIKRQIYSRPVTDLSEEAREESPVISQEFFEQTQPDEAKKTEGFLEKLKDKVFAHLPKDQDEQDDDLWFDDFDEKDAKPAVSFEEVPYMPAAEDTVKAAGMPGEEASLRVGDTMILTDIGDKLGIHILRALDAGAEDIPLLYYPFIIGKQENLVDHRLEDDSVSRLHLKIEMKDERYLIEDLNSTNGTSLNGKLLENNEEREISVGDEIDIARLRYRFE